MEITFAQAVQKVKANPQRARLIDVREDDEFKEGHLPQAESYPLSTFLDAIKAQSFDPDALLLVYCRSGARSGRAAQALRELGYKDAYNIGGIMDYQEEFGPLEKGGHK